MGDLSFEKQKNGGRKEREKSAVGLEEKRRRMEEEGEKKKKKEEGKRWTVGLGFGLRKRKWRRRSGLKCGRGKEKKRK